MRCKAEDCDRDSVTSYGLCVMHYKRLKRNGTTDRVLNSYSERAKCKIDGCVRRPAKNGMCAMHYHKVRLYGRTHNIIAAAGSGTINIAGYRVHTVNGKRVYEHVLVVERALGKPLPFGAVVHHVNGNPADNRPENLVLCPSQSYHMELHQRQKRLEISFG